MRVNFRSKTDKARIREEYWKHITAGIGAAHVGDHPGHINAILGLQSAPPSQGRASAYVYLLLQLVLIHIGGDELETDESARRWLVGYADDVYPNWAPLIGRPERVLEALFLTPFGFAPAGEEVQGADLVFLGTAALGVILDNPVIDLDYLIPTVDSWWDQNHDLVLSHL